MKLILTFLIFGFFNVISVILNRKLMLINCNDDDLYSSTLTTFKTKLN